MAADPTGAPGALVELSDRLFVHHASSPGRPQIGVIVDDDGVTVVDSGLTPRQGAEVTDAVAPLGLPIRRAVLTSSHIPSVGGTSSLTLAAMYGSAQTSAHLEQPPNVAGYRVLHPEAAAEFDDDLRTRPVSHVVSDAAWISATAVAVPTGGELLENLVVQVPEAGVVFAGAMACFGETPLAFDGDPLQWANALDDILGWGSVIVPGRGPVGGEAEVRELQAYLWACAEADGDPSAIPDGPWDAWSNRHYDEVNVERAALLAAGDADPPPSMLRLLGLR